MSTKSRHTKRSGQRRYAPGTSRGRHSTTTLLAQVADIERGQRIKALREALHLTQPAVVDLMERAARELPEDHPLQGKAPVTLRGYQTYERGGGIVWDKAKLLAQALQTDVHEIMNGVRSETPEPFPSPPAIQGELAEVLQAIRDQLEKQSRVLERIERTLEVERTAAETMKSAAEQAGKLVQQIDADVRSGRLPKFPPASKAAAAKTAAKRSPAA